MGLFGLFSKKKNEEDFIPEKPVKKEDPSDDLLTVIDAREHGAQKGQNIPGEEEEPEFIFGVEAVSLIPQSMDLYATGKLKGTIHIGDAMWFTNPGDDHDKNAHSGEIVDIIQDGKQIDKASDGRNITVRIDKGAELPVRPSTVGHPHDVSDAELRSMYTSRLGDIYVVRKNLILTDNELNALSITDLEEIWRLFIIYHTQMVVGESKEQIFENKTKLDRLVGVLCRKILESDSIYCLYNKKTGEPHMFSNTVNRGDGTVMCTPPSIRICTESYREGWEKTMPEFFELRKISTGDDGQGVYNFFGSAFYLNGASGVQIINPNTIADKAMLVEEPDFTGVPEEQIPVTNPALVRWMLMIGQMGAPKTEEAKKVFSLYYQLESQELVKAKLLIPIQDTNDQESANEEGDTTLHKGSGFRFPTVKGKNGRTAARMFTDWKRFRMVYGEEYTGLIQQIGGMIEEMDCAINATAYPAAGAYVSKDAFDRMMARYGMRQPVAEPAEDKPLPQTESGTQTGKENAAEKEPFSDESDSVKTDEQGTVPNDLNETPDELNETSDNLNAASAAAPQENARETDEVSASSEEQ